MGINTKIIKSLSDKRLLIELEVNGKNAPFLVDTGACVGLLDEDSIKKYKLSCKRKYSGTLIGAGGNINSSYICDNFFSINNKVMTLFITSDIRNVLDSIKRETGYLILGIIGLPQMKLVGMKIDLVTNTIIV